MSLENTLLESCQFFSDQAKENIAKLLNLSLKSMKNCESISEFDKKQSLYFSIPFQGDVFGEFVFGMRKDTALHLVGESEVDEFKFEDSKEDIFDIFG